MTPLTRSVGIVRCDMIAESIIAAAASAGGFKVPVVVRLQGTNSDKGLQIVRIHNPLSELHANLERRLKNRDWVIWLSNQTSSLLLKRSWKSHESQCKDLKLYSNCDIPVVECLNM